MLACSHPAPPVVAAAPPPEARLSAPARSAYLQGEVALARGDLSEAERLFRRAVVFDGASAAPRLALAGVLIDAGKVEEARAVIDEVLARDPADPGALALQERIP